MFSCYVLVCPEMEFTKVIVTKVLDLRQLAIHSRGFFSDLRFPGTIGAGSCSPFYLDIIYAFTVSYSIIYCVVIYWFKTSKNPNENPDLSLYGFMWNQKSKTFVQRSWIAKKHKNLGKKYRNPQASPRVENLRNLQKSRD